MLPVLPLVVIAVVLATAPPAAAQTPPQPDARMLRTLDRVVRERMDASDVPGLAVAVVADGRTVHLRGFGEADGSGRPVTGRTPFVTGSSGKAMTALAVAQLVDAGRVDLDAPVRRYVPELRLADGEPVDRITVRHVLQHTSGLRTEAGGPVLRSAQDGSPLDAIAEVRDERLVTAPGEAFHYSNVNYVLAGLVVERASGEPFARYMRRHVFAPLRMRRTFTSLADARRAGLATGSRYWFGLPRWHGPTFPPGLQSAGYYVSTAEDLARFLRVFLGGGVVDGRRLVSTGGLRTLLTPGREARLGSWADGAQARYASGWFAGGPWRERAFLHPGNTPDSSSMLVLLPQRGWGVVTMTNISNELPVPGSPSVPDRLGRIVVDVLLGEPVSGTSARRFYALFDLACAAVLALLLWALARAGLALRRGTRPRHRRRAAAAVAARTLVGTLALLAPGLTVGWAASRLWYPDLTLALVVAGVVLLATAALRAAWLTRAVDDRPLARAEPERPRRALERVGR